MLISHDIVILVVLLISAVYSLQLLSNDFSRSPSHFIHLPRFWTNVGFSPAAPLPLNDSEISRVLLSEDVRQNIEIIAALPNGGVQSIRTHWILSLVKIVQIGEHENDYDFSKLDNFLDGLYENRVSPAFEMMGDLLSTDLGPSWTNLTLKLLQRYTTRYPPSYTSKWKFETWNEPDLHTYNILNMNLEGYIEHITGIANGLRSFNSAKKTSFALRGPAGLFKMPQKHVLCWGLLENCNKNITWCPIDVLTFHRKGENSFNDILNGTLSLLHTIYAQYPNLRGLPFANTEADPTSGWSKSYPTYADVRYSVVLILTVFQHWTAFYTKELENLESISHDNAFLSYHPFEFEQRTLLARFSMNLSNPPHVQFVRKPVHAALGMLAGLGEFASNVQMSDNMTCMTSISENYAAILCTSSNFEECPNQNEFRIRINASGGISDKTSENDTGVFLEYLRSKITDPFYVWNAWNRPGFPSRTLLREMRIAEGPHVLRNPNISRDDSFITLGINFKPPWVILLRFCTKSVPRPHRVNSLRIRTVNTETLLLLWKEPMYHMNVRCVKSYEIFYSVEKNNFSKENCTISAHPKRFWINIAKGAHIPFLSFYHQWDDANRTLNGFYKVRAVDFFNRTGRFSRSQVYYQNSEPLEG